jgi:hypothetical protein
MPQALYYSYLPTDNCNVDAIEALTNAILTTTYYFDKGIIALNSSEQQGASSPRIRHVARSHQPVRADVHCTGDGSY